MEITVILTEMVAGIMAEKRWESPMKRSRFACLTHRITLLIAALMIHLAGVWSPACTDDAKPFYPGASVQVSGLNTAHLFLPVVARPAKKSPITDPRAARFLALPDGYQAALVSIDTLSDPIRRKVFEYLRHSAEAVDSAKLRFRARELAATVTAKAGNKSLASYYAAHRLDPIPLLIVPDCSKGMSASSRALELTDGGRTRTLVSCINVKNSGIRGCVNLTLPGRIRNDTLDLAFLHENTHGIMYDLYGSHFRTIPRPSDNGHDGPIISDRGLAWIEGWAEAFEALYGPANPLLKEGRIDPAKYGLAEFQLTRQDPVRRERYIWNASAKRRSGLLKTGAQLIATEGAVAAIVYDLLTSRAVAHPFDKLCITMVSHHPQDLIELVRGLMETYPNDARTVARIFLENTRYATVDNEARNLYHAYYTAKKAYVQKRTDIATYRSARDAYVRHKETLFHRVIADTSLLSANVGPDLWLSFPRPARKQPAKPRASAKKGCDCPDCRPKPSAAGGQTGNPVEQTIPVNLNTAPPKLLIYAGFTRTQAEELATLRSSSGYLTGAQAKKLLKHFGIAWKPLH